MLSIVEAAPRRRPLRLTFSPLAWLKLQFFCHSGATEIAGFGITAKEDLLYIEDFITVQQHSSAVTVALDDQAVADFSDHCVDAGLTPERYLRVWCHTHPGSSAQPSSTDEETFARVFGTCDWAVMFILSRTANTYARLSIHVGPGAETLLPVSVDWAAWTAVITGPQLSLANLLVDWQKEFVTNVQPVQEHIPMFPGLHSDSPIEIATPWEPFADTWDWHDLDQQLQEEFERHERAFNDDV